MSGGLRMWAARSGAGVAAADGHGDIGVVDPEPGGGVVDAGERCAKVEFHIGA